MISDDKASHLAHLVLGALKKSPQCRLTEDDGRSCAKSNAWWRRNLRWKKRSTRRCARDWRPIPGRLSRAARSGM